MQPGRARPGTTAPQAYKEVSAAQFKDAEGWKGAVPQDGLIRDKCWERFGDPLLNALQEQVQSSNQTGAAAYASFMQARAVVHEAPYWPTRTVAAGVARMHPATGVVPGGAGRSARLTAPAAAIR